ncbi:NADP-dependent glyceraldehyde-3-phosphate dehydrogenase [bacterium]|nr:NADP-dependent glyceraldehyde-3-phosphate dehydrogenase [bacterium]
MPKFRFPTSSEVPSDFRMDPLHQRDYLLDGQILPWKGDVQEVLSPVCLPEDPFVLGSFPSMAPEHSLAAVEAADRAWNFGAGAWPTMRVADRIRCVEDLAQAMAARRQEVARLLMWEIGKTWPDSLKEFDRTLEYIRCTIDAVKELDRTSSRFLHQEGILAQVRRAPLGVTLCMGPFNYPLNETYTTLIPALIMGNPVVFKPSRPGSLLHRPLLEAFRDCFPAGVVNTVYGSGSKVVGPMMESGRISCLAFIGSSGAADRLKKLHPAPHRLRSCLGLGAKNPAIILADADLDLTVRECVLGSLSFNGQRCTALKILFVHRSIAAEFVERMAEAVNGLKAGMPWDEGVSITPLPETGKPQDLRAYVDEAIAAGASIANPGGGEIEGTFFRPAVVYPVAPSTRLYQEEQFGPVVPIVPFDDVAEPIRYLEESAFGQQASLFGRDPQVLAGLIDRLVNQVCRLNVNSQCQRGPDTFPFTGRKDSAEGTLSVSDALRVFSIRTLVAARDVTANKQILTDILRERRSSFLSTDFLF